MGKGIVIFILVQQYIVLGINLISLIIGLGIKILKLGKYLWSKLKKNKVSDLQVTETLDNSHI